LNSAINDDAASNYIYNCVFLGWSLLPRGWLLIRPDVNEYPPTCSEPRSDCWLSTRLPFM